MVFPCCFAGFKHELWRVIDLRQRPEKPMACALQIAKQANYSPKQGSNYAHQTAKEPDSPLVTGLKQPVSSIPACFASSLRSKASTTPSCFPETASPSPLAGVYKRIQRHSAKATGFRKLAHHTPRLSMKKQTSLRILFSSTLLALGLWSIPAAQAQICTREYAPVCGHIAGQTPQTFPNRCVLDNAQARFIAQGECPNTALPHTQPTPQPQPMPGSDSDAHGCKGSAGFV
jgi:hypothetical protein